MTYPRRSSSSNCFQMELGFRKVSFCRGRKAKNTAKNPLGRDKNQQQTQYTGNGSRVILVEGERYQPSDTKAPHINLFLHWRSLTMYFIVIKASFFVPLYHLLFPQPLALPLQQRAVGLHHYAIPAPRYISLIKKN